MIRSIAASLRDVIAEHDVATGSGLVGGLVKTIRRRTQGKVEGQFKVQEIPVDCGVTGAECTDGAYSVMIPHSGRKSVFFFQETQGGTRRTKAGPRQWEFEATIRLIGWLNLDKLGLSQSDTCDGPRNSTRLWNEFLTLFPSQVDMPGACPLNDVTVEFVREAPSTESPWAAWPSLQEEVRQFLMLPYEHFIIELKVTWRANPACIQPIIVGEEYLCEGPAPPSRPSVPSDPCTLIRVCGTPTSGQVVTWTGAQWEPQDLLSGDTIAGGRFSWDPVLGLMYTKDAVLYQVQLNPQ